MTFFLLKDNKGRVQLVQGKFALPYLKKMLNEYKEWLEEAKTRKRFATSTEAHAAKGGVDGFIWYLDLIKEPVSIFAHEYLEELNIDNGRDKTITSNPSIA